MTQDDDKKPQRRTKKTTKKISRPRKKQLKKDEDTEVSTDSENKKISDSYKKKIEAALEANLEEYIKNRNLNQKQISTINSFIEEHLSCFVLLGYTVNGDPVSLVNAPTQKDSDSLGTLLQKFLGKYTEPPNNISMM